MPKKSLVCAECRKPIEQDFLRALGKYWHLDHFKCAKCRKILSTETFFEKNGLPYCRSDYLRNFCHKCGKCNGYITKEAVKAFGKFWHVNCFTCATCDRPIRPPFYFEKEGKPYCNNDYARNFAPVCKGCGEHIFEDYLYILGEKYHHNCFKCKECKKPIQKKYYIVNQKEVCLDCKNENKKQKWCCQSCCKYLDRHENNDEE